MVKTDVHVSGPFFHANYEKLVHDALDEGMGDMGDVALGLAQSAWSDKATYANSLIVAKSKNKHFVSVRSRYYGRPYPGNATAKTAGGPVLSWWLERGMRKGARIGKGHRRWYRTGTAIKAINRNDWFLDRIVGKLDG